MSTQVEPAPGVTMQAPEEKTRRRWSVVLVLFVAGVIPWFGWTWWSAHRYRAAMTAIDAQMAAGKFGAAARDLEKILASRSNSDEAAYVLGICEQARGRTQAADQAWARVGPGSSFTQRATLARLRLFHDTGHLAKAEQAVLDAAEEPRNDRTDLLVLLVPIFSQIGRSAEAAQLIEARWDDLNQRGEATPDQSIKLVKLHIELIWTTRSPEELRVYLDQVGKLAPDDDRVWLGRADLAIQTGNYDEANRWLDACLKRRPDDVPVWRARLNWAMATNRVDVAQEAQKRIPTHEWTSVDTHRLSAWLAARRGDEAVEARELELLIAETPADLKALDRLAQLAQKAGQTDRAAEFARKKTEILAARTRYLKLNDRMQHTRNAEELATLARQLGSRFESRVFLSLALTDEPARRDLQGELSRLTPTDHAFARQPNLPKP